MLSSICYMFSHNPTLASWMIRGTSHVKQFRRCIIVICYTSILKNLMCVSFLQFSGTLYTIMIMYHSMYLMRTQQGCEIVVYTSWLLSIGFYWFTMNDSIELALWICDWACNNQPCECKLHQVIFLLISFVSNALSQFCKLQKKAH